MKTSRIGARTVWLAAVVWSGLAALPAAAASLAKVDYLARRAALDDITAQLSMTSAKAAGDLIFSSDFDLVAASCTADRDADRLADCHETGTGRYLSPQDTGTSPDVSDTDGDGLLDGDEVLGTAEGLALPALGVSPLRRDILLEYDWFDTTQECGAISHRPSAGAMARVTEMFAAAPVTNPDGSTGINVVHDYGQGGAFVGGNRIEGYSAVLPGRLDATYYAIRNANYDAERLGYFHYVLMAHRYDNGSNSSGYAEVVGDDMIVSLYCANSDVNVGNTIAHELGHNLGLDHGGFEACNGKPNYNSIMNYRYQFAGVDRTCTSVGSMNTADFSAGDRMALDENALDEPRGVCGSQPVDWNDDGNLETGLALDVNADYGASCGGAKTELEDFADWDNVTFAGVLDKHGLLKSVQRETGCAGAPVGTMKH